MKCRSSAGNGSVVFAEARVRARVCVRAAHPNTQAQNAHGVARPLNRILEEFLQRRHFACRRRRKLTTGEPRCDKERH